LIKNKSYFIKSFIPLFIFLLPHLFIYLAFYSLIRSFLIGPPFYCTLHLTAPLTCILNIVRDYDETFTFTNKDTLKIAAVFTTRSSLFLIGTIHSTR